MIVAYAQAEDRDGVDAALNGKSVAATEPDFTRLREKSSELNIAAVPHRIGDVAVRYGKGIVRLEFSGADDGSRALSPVVLVADISEVLRDRKAVVSRAVESVAAIGRRADSDVIEVGLAEGERLHRSVRLRRVLMFAFIATLATAGIVWLSTQLASGLGR